MGLSYGGIQSVLNIEGCKNFWCADYASGLNNPNYTDGTLINGVDGKLVNLGYNGSNTNLFHRNNRNEGNTSNSSPDNFVNTSAPTFRTVGGINSKSFIQFTGQQFIVQEALNPSFEQQFIDRLYDYRNGFTYFYLVERVVTSNSDRIININSVPNAVGRVACTNNGTQHANSSNYIPNNSNRGTASLATHDRRYNLVIEVRNSTSSKYYVASDGFTLTPRVFEYTAINAGMQPNTYQVFLMFGALSNSESNYWGALVGQNFKLYTAGIFEKALNTNEIGVLMTWIKRHYNL